MNPFGYHKKKDILLTLGLMLITAIIGYIAPYLLVAMLVGLYFFNERTQEDTRSSLSPYKPYTTLMYISAKKKREYLNSTEWGILRAAAFDRDNHTCQSCGATTQLECHHITYERLTQERLSDVVTICRNCHQKIHNKYGYDRETYYPI